MSDPGQQAAEAVVRRAIELGYLTRAQVEAARARGGDLLAQLGPALTPAQRAELQGAHAQAFNAASTLPPQEDGSPFASVVGKESSERHVETLQPDASLSDSHDSPALRLLLPGSLQRLQPGTDVGPYRLVRELGRGGMGVVFEAEHTMIRRRVALKVLASHAATPKAVKRFLLEARAAAGLRHPNVIAVHDAGQEGDLHYMAMDLVEGESLAERIRRAGPLTVPEALDLTEAMADALRVAHEQGILHRDIKPSNIMLTGDGHAYLADFGLAKLTDSSQGGLTQSKEILGTPAYMSPEQADGRAKDADGRIDIYSLGATLYEALTGVPPFKATTMIALIAQIMQATPAPPSTYRSAVPPALDALVARCMRKRPGDRYPDAGALLEAARACKAGAPAPSRLPVIAACLFGVLILVAVAGGVVWALRSRAPGPPPAVEDDPPPTNPLPEDPPSAPAFRAPAWTSLSPATQPSPRFDAAAAYSPALKRIVLHGGRTDWKRRALKDTWAWNGSTWELLSDAGPPRAAHSMAWDAKRSRLVQVGGLADHRRPGGYLLLRGVHEWVDGAWRRREDLPAYGGPEARQELGLAFDPARGQVVLSGGRSVGKLRTDTWTLGETSWQEVAKDSAPFAAARCFTDPERGVLRYDSAPPRSELDGGGVIERLEGDAWTEALTLGLEGRVAGQAVWTPHGIVFLGLLDTEEAKTWVSRIWRDETWIDLPWSAEALYKHSLVYDPERDVVIAFGGLAPGATPLDSTYELRFGDPSSAAEPTPDGSWARRDVRTRPPARLSHRMAYAPELGGVFVHGGDPGPRRDLWCWDGSRWDLVSEDGPARSLHGLAYDPSRKRLVLFGGIHGESRAPSSTDVWEWDGARWAQRTDLADGPGPRAHHGMVYDPARGGVVVAAGRRAADTTDLPLDDVWLLTSEGWSKLPHVPAHSAAPLVLDQSSGALVAVSGLVHGRACLPEMLTSTSDGWKRSPLPATFPPRSHHAVAWGADRMLVVGGHPGPAGERIADAWAHRAGGWTELPWPGPKVFGSSLVYDERRRTFVAFGGRGQAGYLFDTTWELRLPEDPSWPPGAIASPPADVPPTFTTAWIERHPERRPPPRYDAALIHDPVRDVTLLFGGWGETEAQGDTWTWDGTEWTPVAGAAPPPRAQHAMAYDPEAKQIVLHGGVYRRWTTSSGKRQLAENTQYDDAWAWAPESGWTRLPGALPLRGHGLVYDAKAKRLLAVGGFRSISGRSYNPETVARTADGWAPIGPGPKRASFGFACDPLGTPHLFAGLSGKAALGDLLRWSGDTWERAAPAGDEPLPRKGAAMVATPRGLVVLGGAGSKTELADAWLWTGEAWQRLPNLPIPMNEPALSYDRGRDVLTAFGGALYPRRLLDRTFELKVGSE